MSNPAYPLQVATPPHSLREGPVQAAEGRVVTSGLPLMVTTGVGRHQWRRREPMANGGVKKGDLSGPG